MIPATVPSSPASSRLIEQLGHLCRDRGLPGLASRLLDLQGWMHGELAHIERDLATVPQGVRAVQKAAHHLLDLDGKHLRPMCVALAAKVGTGFSEAARQLAISVELVHTATLLHDDVIDMATTRRGTTTARVIYGNAASIFAGDWLLVEALKRIRRAAVPRLLDEMLDIIEEMILAESIQLENRGDIRGDRENYFRVVEGKTAALFRWAMVAGGRAGGLSDAECAALADYGLHLGVAFQAVDDCLDFGGDVEITGKALFTDLREGKVTYPLILAIERDPSLLPLLHEATGGTAEQPVPEAVRRGVLLSLRRTGALADSLQLARDRVAHAVACLDGLPDGAGKTALITVAEATSHRQR